jgi:hypothetical protein
MSKLCNVEIVQEAGNVFDREGKEDGGEGGQNDDLYSSSCKFFVQHVLLVNKHITAQPSSCATTRNPRNDEVGNKI